MVEVNDRKFTVILREETKGFSAQVVELPGCISQGKNKKDAIEGYLEAFPEELGQLGGKRELVEVTV